MTKSIPNQNSKLSNTYYLIIHWPNQAKKRMHISETANIECLHELFFIT